MGKLLGKVAIVTGASRGIGRNIAIELAKEGTNIVINYSKDDEGAQETLNCIKSIGGYAVLCKEDISSYESTKKIIEFTINTLGKVDILVNNAAKSIIGLFMDSSEEGINEIINTNFLGAIYMSKHVLPYMVSNGGGTIVNISSMWGDVGASCEVLYSASKGGLNLFTKSLAKEMAPSNIRVNGVAPGVIDTNMNSFLEEDERKSLEEEIPMGRFGKPSEIGKIVTFLCSDDSSYITGQIIRADGGYI
ncbi:elongation factor P 5-aminopentanone reductase [Clostridium uliginosum]|uniref:3-oxoacyl-[acyl-carrier protein] reductase n=1 Tax=Clostridium uliginosum TaxID=119641 RepID=A0A1I1MVT6_9CLOT|nr:SDR family oxidoreductase [Clostridium uliginosum]SFC89275.1 3-oxoacyl-[acyl-carrier protein] reductase [Clostridium uliginosum]